MKRIPLSRGKGFALVDDEDYELLSQYRWRMTGGGYAIRTETVYMHKLLLPGKVTDHANGNRLDNRRRNLRRATYGDNACNRAKSLGKSSEFIGVGWSKRDKVWKSQIGWQGKLYYLGDYKEERLAALMHDFWAPVIQGEFSKPNFNVVSQWTSSNG